MNSVVPLKFKIASEDWEFQQIHQLNYKTFVQEIKQHPANKEKLLVDKFHEENTYIICLRGDRLVGMIAFRDRRPFSLDQKLPNLDAYLPQGRKVCEVRLLAVEKGERKGHVFHGLVKKLAEHGRCRDFDMAVISGTTRQIKLYRHLGFTPFGPLVGTDKAKFQPMYLTLEAVEEKARHILPENDPATAAEPESFLPGPVAIGPEIRQAFSRAPVSHRSRAFMLNFQEIKWRLCSLVNAKRVEIFVGSGTLANDVVAGQISLLEGRGLILNNGEFGTRLVDHATRMGVRFTVLPKEWGEIFTREEIEAALDRAEGVEWLWAVHCETSTTVLNDLNMFKQVAASRGLKLCLDCTSSVGTVPMDLGGVFLASSVSGKGLGSFPGLSMVFYDHDVRPAPTALPRYLDMGAYAASNGVPYTHSSNLLYALQKALERFWLGTPYEDLKMLSAWLRSELRGAGFILIADDAHASPAIVTITLPPEISSESVGDRLEDAGYLLSYRSGYLLKRNWLQICLMGESSRERLGPVLEILKEVCFLSRGAVRTATRTSPWRQSRVPQGSMTDARGDERGT